MENAWLGVVSAAHVRLGVAGGFAQVQHGRRHGLDRLHRGDGFVYYSPAEVMGARTPLRAFTALGVVTDDATFQHDGAMYPGSSFRPFRRSVAWLDAEDLPLREVTDDLDLTSTPNWGYALRRGLLPLSLRDHGLLRARMAAGSVPAWTSA